jgi:chaperone modulatory protein CbpM
MDTPSFMQQACIDAAALERWIEAGWIVPRRGPEARRFSDVDVARAALIEDLRRRLGVDDESVAIILDLLDQIHGLRATLREIIVGVHAQPETVQRKIIADIRDARATRASGSS